MNTRTYNALLRNFANVATLMSAPYDYAGNGGSNGNSKPADFTASLPLDIWANENAFVVQAYLPGVKPEEVEITMEGEELTIRGRFPQAHEGVKFAKRELFHGEFARRLNISIPVNVEAITAEYEHGVLTLTLPKAEEVKPKQIKVMAK
jgi:HSP20 family protein